MKSKISSIFVSQNNDKMKNIHLLPTDKSTTLFKDDFGNLIYSINMDQEQNHFEPQHIYITSNEEIKEGDWIFNEEREPSVLQCIGQGSLRGWNKIILTTDQDLIKDGVQAIDDEFLEWFVKNPNCEWVDIETMMECEKCGKEHCDNLQCRGYKDIPYYKIIIPKEEPKQETLEEAAEKYSENWEETTGLDYENTVPSEVNKLDFIHKLKFHSFEWWMDKLNGKKYFDSSYLSPTDTHLDKQIEFLNKKKEENL